MFFLDDLGMDFQEKVEKENSINIENEEIENELNLKSDKETRLLGQITVDRFEGDIVVLEDRKNNKMINVKREDLPANIKEGDILKEVDGKYFIDEELTQKTSQRIKRKKQNNKIKIIESIIAIVILALISIFGTENEILNQLNRKEEVSSTSTSSNLEAYFIDVGQADSILIKNNNEAMLIDAGNNEDGEDVVKFIKEKGINKLNYVVGTHPHEDHIGGLDDVINSDIEIENILMSKIQTNTKTFEDVLDAISNKGLKITEPKKGDTFQIGEASCEIMTDSIINEKNLNLSSITIRLQFGNNSMLLMGDSEVENEKTRTWPKTDVLKVGHHGSLTSSSEEFLNEVQPQYAIIMVGKNNSYKLPKQEILDRLNKRNIKIHRTDEEGTIELIMNGNEILIY